MSAASSWWLRRAALLPIVLARRASNYRVSVVAAAMVIVATGATADSRIETRGLQRNAFGALVGSRMTRIGQSADTPANSEHARKHQRASPSKIWSTCVERREDETSCSIVLESTAARYLGLYGAARDPMPILTELGRQAVVFDAAYAVYPESIKGLFSTICSRYPHSTRRRRPMRGCPAFRSHRDWRESGYRTALFHSGRFEYLGMAPMIADRGFEVLKDAGRIGGNVRSSFGVDEPSTVRRCSNGLMHSRRANHFF